MTGIHVALDYDDVIADFGGQVVKTVNKEYGVKLSLEDITSWNLSELLDPIIGEDWWTWWEERDWLWANADAIDGAIGGIRTLKSRGHYVEIVTATPPWAKAGKLEWLGKWKPDVDRITFGTARPPMDKVAATDAIVIVDDKPETVRAFINDGRYGILFDRPHNADALDLDIVRARGWGDVLEQIEDIAALVSLRMDA